MYNMSVAFEICPSGVVHMVMIKTSGVARIGMGDTRNMGMRSAVTVLWNKGHR